MSPYDALGAVMILTGIIINYAINRRRFYRRGPAGLQHFKTYGGAVVTTWLERLGKLIAIILILLGIGAFITGHDKKVTIGKSSGDSVQKRHIR